MEECADCGEKIVHPNRQFRVCLDCLIIFIDKHIDFVPTRWVSRECDKMKYKCEYCGHEDKVNYHGPGIFQCPNCCHGVKIDPLSSTPENTEGEEKEGEK